MAPNEWERVPGAIDPSLSSIQMVQHPSLIRAGVPFEVVVTTLGSSSCTRSDGAEVQVEGSTIRIIPFDRVAPTGTACTRDLRGFARGVLVTFPEPGRGSLVIEGRRATGVPDDYLFDLTVEP